MSITHSVLLHGAEIWQILNLHKLHRIMVLIQRTGALCITAADHTIDVLDFKFQVLNNFLEIKKIMFRMKHFTILENEYRFIQTISTKIQ